MNKRNILLITAIVLYLCGFYLYPKATSIVMIFAITYYYIENRHNITILENKINYKGTLIESKDIIGYKEIIVSYNEKNNDFIILKLKNPQRLNIYEKISIKIMAKGDRQINIIDKKENTFLNKQETLNNKKNLFLPKDQSVVDFIKNNNIKEY